MTVWEVLRGEAVVSCAVSVTVTCHGCGEEHTTEAVSYVAGGGMCEYLPKGWTPTPWGWVLCPRHRLVTEEVTP